MSDNCQGWDTMFLRKKHNEFGDSTTNKLVNKGVISFDKDDYVDDNVIRLRDINMIVSMWYIFILSIFLCWLPLFGQMIAGYLGGRKAGSAVRGLVATLIPCFLILIILIMVDAGLLPSLGLMGGVPSTLVGGLSSVSPRAGAYLGGIFGSLGALTGLNGNGLVIIIAFGLIGGMMADMNKKEIAQATGGGNTFDGLSSFLSGANIGKFADLVAERVLWTLGTVDQGSRKLLGRGHQEPSAMDFGEMKSLPAPSNDYAPQPRLKEWMGPEPEPAFGYKSEPGDDFEHNLLEGIPAMEPRRKTIKHEPYEMEWGVSHKDLKEDSLVDSWKEHNKRNDYGGDGPRDREQEIEPPKTPRKKAQPRKKIPAQKRDAVVYDSKGKELEAKKPPKRKATPAIKKQPALIKRALEKQEKIEKESKKAVKVPAIEPREEQEVAIPKKEKITQTYDIL